MILVLGAPGFIGARVAAQATAEGFSVKAGARHADAARQRLPQLDWVQADFARLITTADRRPLLEA